MERIPPGDGNHPVLRTVNVDRDKQTRVGNVQNQPMLLQFPDRTTIEEKFGVNLAVYDDDEFSLFWLWLEFHCQQRKREGGLTRQLWLYSFDFDSCENRVEYNAVHVYHMGTEVRKETLSFRWRGGGTSVTSHSGKLDETAVSKVRLYGAPPGTGMIF